MKNRFINKKIIKKAKISIAVIQVILTVSINVLSGFAAAPQVTVDETVYTNLDYYGITKDLSIVKGVSLNGYSDFQDFGEYINVINMTSDNTPNMAADAVSFSNLDSSKKFYYEVTPKSNKVELPWTFDVSYKLNGVPAKAENLAGASGLIEINISAKPETTKSDYLNNNMILMVGTDVDMTKNLSVEAPGAQIQSVGKNSIVLFMAFPGEEKNFVIRIGSDSFESAGIVMAMVPATMDSLDKIKDINDAKDDIKNSANAIYNSSNALIDVFSSMGIGLENLNGGLKELQSARAAIHSYGNNLTGQTDEVIRSLGSLAESTSQMVPHLVTAKDALNDFNKDVNKVDEEMKFLRPALLELTDSMGDVDNSIDHIGYLLKNSKINEANAQLPDLSNKLASAKKKLEQLKQILDRIRALSTSSNAMEDTTIRSMNESLEQIYTELTAANILPASGESSAESLYYNLLQNTASSTDSMYQALNNMIEKTNAYIDFVNANIAGKGVNAIKDIQDGISASRDLANTTSDMIDDMQVTTISLADVIEDMNHLTVTANEYHNSALSAIDSAENLTNTVDNNIVVAADTLNTINNMYKSSKDILNSGAKNSVSASMDLINKTLDGIGITKTLKESNDTIKSVWDDKIDELETDSNILKIDTEATKPSFTSDKNPEPNSVQVILRTQEIKKDSDNSIVDMDVDEDNMTPIKRIGNVFKKIFDFVRSFISGK